MSDLTGDKEADILPEDTLVVPPTFSDLSITKEKRRVGCILRDDQKW